MDRLVGEHQFRAAREILRQGVVEAGEAGEPLKTRLVRLDEECARYCDQLIEQAEGLRKSGQYVVAVTQLDQESWRFPEGPSANRLTRMMEQLTADIRAHPSVTPLMPGDPDAWKRAAASTPGPAS